MNNSLIGEGLLLLVIGMTIVYLFLILMVWIMTIMRKPITLLDHFLPDPVTAAPKRVPAVQGDDALIAVAVAMASRR